MSKTIFLTEDFLDLLNAQHSANKIEEETGTDTFWFDVMLAQSEYYENKFRQLGHDLGDELDSKIKDVSISLFDELEIIQNSLEDENDFIAARKVLEQKIQSEFAEFLLI